MCSASVSSQRSWLQSDCSHHVKKVLSFSVSTVSMFRAVSDSSAGFRVCCSACSVTDEVRLFFCCDVLCHVRMLCVFSVVAHILFCCIGLILYCLVALVVVSRVIVVTELTNTVTTIINTIIDTLVHHPRIDMRDSEAAHIYCGDANLLWSVCKQVAT